MADLRVFSAGIALSVIVATSQLSTAGIISYTKITNDADSGISSANTYTHAVDFQRSGTGAAVVNGVQFDAYTKSGNPGLALAVTAFGSLGDLDGGGTVTTTGGVSALMEGFVFNNGFSSSATGEDMVATLSGLEEGQQYELRIYTHRWTGGTRNVSVTFDPDGGGPIADATPTLNQEDARTALGPAAAVDDSYYISYTYQATSTQNLRVFFDQETNNSWHLYGLTNQVALIPTPEALTVLGSGLLLMARRQRARDRRIDIA